jgi:hypothetical protein
MAWKYKEPLSLKSNPKKFKRAFLSYLKRQMDTEEKAMAFFARFGLCGKPGKAARSAK